MPVKEKNKNNEIDVVFSNSAKYGIILQEDFFDKDIANKTNIDGYYIVKPYDFVYNPRISNSAPVGPIKQNQTGLTGIVSPLYSVFRISEDINSNYINHYFSTTKWHKYIKGVANYGARHDRINITQKDLYNMSISIPSNLEQKRISEFLSLVGIKIELLEKRYVNYQNFKKYLMQEIFAQNLRFTDCNEYTLKQISEKIENGFSGTQVNYETQFPVTRIETISSGKINYDKVGFVDEIPERYILQEGDILLTNINSMKWIGNSVYYDEKRTLYHGMNLILLRSKKEINSKYLYYYITYNNNWFKKMACQAVNQASINKSTLEKFMVKIPDVETQNNIAKVLTFADEKINAISNQVELATEFKKGLLQQMFV